MWQSIATKLARLSYRKQIPNEKSKDFPEGQHLLLLAVWLGLKDKYIFKKIGSKEN